MAFSDFRYPDVLSAFDLRDDVASDLFAGVAPIAPGPISQTGVEVGARLGASAHTENSRAVWMVGPVLADLWDRYDATLCVIAGAELDADPDAGLTGTCDFVLGRGPHCRVVRPPVRVVITQARRDSIMDTLGTGVACMVATARVNERAGAPVDPVYGCVTTGSFWRFLRLSGRTLPMDFQEYSLRQTDRLLGNLTHMLGPVPTPAAA